MLRPKKLFLSVLIGLLFLEIILRSVFGFCDTVLIKKDPNYEYIAKPNQNRFRFLNDVRYNSFSMRSEEVDTTAAVILGFGDSVINGGVLSDQSELATSILSDTLSSIFQHKVQVLNISAGSWGPDNCYAYLKKHGSFNATGLILFVSSHDAFDNMDFKETVGIDKSFPSKQYSFAILELASRYIVPRIKNEIRSIFYPSRKTGIDKRIAQGTSFNVGFQNFIDFSNSKNLPIIIYLHADLNELKAGEYNEQGKLIIDFASQNKIPIVKDLDANLTNSEFRDAIHINSVGQTKLAFRALPFLRDSILLRTKY